LDHQQQAHRYLSVATQANNSLNDQSGGGFDLTEGNFTRTTCRLPTSPELGVLV